MKTIASIVMVTSLVLSSASVAVGQLERASLKNLAMIAQVGQEFSEDLTNQIDQMLDEYAAFDLFSGTVLVARDGEPIYTSAVGEANKDHHVRNTLDTKFPIGSIGKTFTGVAVMQLAQAGKLDVNDPVIEHLPDFPFGDKITIHHLLTHTSGMGNYFSHPDFECRKYSIRSIDDALELVYDQDLVHETPGEEFSYSNSGMITLGAVIEAVSGQSYSDYIEENILEPAGMFDTGINYLDEIVENRAAGYMKRPLGGNMPNVFRVPPANSDGNIETTVGDMLKFDQALYDDTLLDEKHRQMLFTPLLENYAYGWRVDTRHGNKAVGHAGGASGVSADFRRYLNDMVTVIVLSNYSSPEASIAAMVGNGIEAILFGHEYEPPRKPLYEMFYESMLEDGIEYTWEHADEILTEHGYTMMMGDLPNSGPLNRFGYVLLGEEEFNMAIAVFEKNIELFPQDANCYDSLGEAYLTIGNVDRAREYYEKALEVDPEFESAIRMLEKIGE